VPLADADGWIDSAAVLSGGQRTMATFIAVARTDELTPGQGKLVEVNQKRIALFNVGGCYYALDDVCPHRGGPLSEGEIEGATVVCPWHGATFDLATGNVTRPPATARITTYDVRLNGEEIAIAV
jgi:nitrite reductase/ring-hydroxylating ferredoxin subunit